MENSKIKIAKAIQKVMKSVKGIEKNAEIGSGNFGYKGIKDQDVKRVFLLEMEKQGLCIMPIDIQETTDISRWEEESTYSGKTTIKQKQSVFTKVVTKYLLLHESGESIELSGYGHGVDTQDKGAGKATTYALKNCLLYTFLTPVGDIDDSDSTHSDDISSPPVKTIERVILTEEQFKKAMKADVIGIKATLKSYDTKLKGMTQAHKIELEKQLDLLELS